MPNRIVHFEIEAKDIDRAKKFYSEALGWKVSQMGEEYGDYIVVETGKTGDVKDWGINGGIYKSMKDEKEINAYRCVVGVKDIAKAVNNVKNAGGKALSEKPQNIPNVGLFVSCEDTEGNKFTLLQPSPMMADTK